MPSSLFVHSKNHVLVHVLIALPNVVGARCIVLVVWLLLDYYFYSPHVSFSFCPLRGVGPRFIPKAIHNTSFHI